MFQVQHKYSQINTTPIMPYSAPKTAQEIHYLAQVLVWTGQLWGFLGERPLSSSMHLGRRSHAFICGVLSEYMQFLGVEKDDTMTALQENNQNVGKCSKNKTGL